MYQPPIWRVNSNITVVPGTTYCVCEKDLRPDINPLNNNLIDNAWGWPFEAEENKRGNKVAWQERFIPPAAKEISLTNSGVHSSVLFAFQLGSIQMEDREVLKVFTQ